MWLESSLRCVCVYACFFGGAAHMYRYIHTYMYVDVCIYVCIYMHTGALPINAQKWSEDVDAAQIFNIFL